MAESFNPIIQIDHSRREVTLEVPYLNFQGIVEALQTRRDARQTAHYGVLVRFDGLLHRADVERDGSGLVTNIVVGTPAEERVRRCNESAVAVLEAIRTLGFDAVEYGALAGLQCPGLRRVPDRDMRLLVMVFDDEPLRSEFSARWEQEEAIRGLVGRTSLVPADLLFVSAPRFREAGWLHVEPHLRLSPEGVLYLASDSVTKYEVRPWIGP